MKRITKSLSLLTMLTLSYGCNEKISPELQTGNSTTVPPTITPTEYYFRLTNNSPAVLNYVLHRTGVNRETVECSVTSTVALDNDSFRSDVSGNGFDDRSKDIACYMEAEELALYFNGLNFNVEASLNTCDYISYSPYSYFDAIPGNTSPKWAGVVCDEPVTTADFTADAASVAHALLIGAHNDNTGPIDTPINCNTMVDTNVAAGSRVAFPIPDDFQKMCVYDYTDAGAGGEGNGQNCDIGIQNIKLMRVYNVATPPAPTDATYEEIADERHNCGGKVAACVAGAIRTDSFFDGAISGSSILATTSNSDFSFSFELPKLIGNRSNMVDIVNYRRGLASLHLDYKDYHTDNTYWGDATYRYSFDPSLMEKYAANKHPNGTTIISSAQAQSYGFLLNGLTATPLAAEPFLGVEGNKINPFYTFLCLDRAFDVKARIRMVVRDWDRVFPSNTASMSYISDVFEASAGRRQDVPSDEEEVPGDDGDYGFFNDKDDWDVLIPMRRWRKDDVTLPYPHGVYTNNSGIVWEPDNEYLQLSLPWFLPNYFPKAGPR